MKIVIDLQSNQGISKKRGIGRYSISLSQELARQSKHEIYLVCNANLPEEIEFIRDSFDGLVAPDHIKVFEVPKKISGHDFQHPWKIKAAEKIREQYIANISPDLVFISSIFEGWIDDAPVSIGEFTKNSLSAVTLYDLIPFIYPNHYINNFSTPNFFYQKMQYLKQSDLLITLSDSGSQEAIDHLSFPIENIFNCSVGLDSKFLKYQIPKDKKLKLKTELGIIRDIIFYVGGMDYRKNIVNLIEAFSILPNRQQFQLVIIVSIEEYAVIEYQSIFTKRFKLNKDELILIKYVTEETLLILYNICQVFVFPSLHEGFGLPIIEAMACGAPTIGSNVSCIPEVIGCKEALFDPKNPQSIAKKINEVLTNINFKNYLIQHNQEQIKLFTWSKTAKKGLAAFESVYELNKTSKNKLKIYRKKKLAFISPLPPEKTGIADYSALLIPELACYYDIVLITDQISVSNVWLNANFKIRNPDWFKQYAKLFDLILYSFGNSSFHHYMFDLLSLHPGVVILHDFYLGGLLDWMDDFIPKKKNIFNVTLYQSHGYPALIFQERNGRINTHSYYPCNLPVISKALGVIVHSKYTRDLAEKWYGQNISDKFKVINHLSHSNIEVTQKIKKNNKKKLGFCENAFLICSFGNLHPNKLNHRLLNSCIDILLNNHNIYLVFIGEKPYPSYFEVLLNIINKHNLKERVQFRDYVELNDFQNFLLATDLAVQLRANSRGETSGCILSCLNYGIPTIANVNGSIAEFPDEVFVKITEDFSDQELKLKIEYCYQNMDIRHEKSTNAIKFIKEKNHPAKTGNIFYNTLEEFYLKVKVSESQLIRDLINIPEISYEQEYLLSISQIVAANRPAISYPQLLIDISQLKIDNADFSSKNIDILKYIINTTSQQLRPEPIFYNKEQKKFFYARNFILTALKIPLNELKDVPIDIHDNDIFLSLFPSEIYDLNIQNILNNFGLRNIKIYTILFNNIIHPANYIYELAEACLCLKKEYYGSLTNYLESSEVRRKKPMKIGFIDQHGCEDFCISLTSKINLQQWDYEWKKENISWPKITSITRDIYIDNRKYNFEGDTRYLSGAPQNFDAITLSIFQSFCQKDSWVLDLGANIGLTAIALADICYEGRIAAIEPLAPTFHFLNKNIKNANKQNISLHQFAVGSKTGEINMQATSDFLAGAFIADQYQADKNHFTLNVQVKILDEVFEQFNFKKIDFIKMDLEGYELFALEGGKAVLNKFKPNVCLEMNHWCLNVFHRISLPEFKERLCKIFPYVYAIEYPDYLDFTTTDNFYHIAHEHVTTTRKYFNLIAGFNKDDIVNKLYNMKTRIDKLLMQ